MHFDHPYLSPTSARSLIIPLQARKAEGELDVKLSAYNKLCSGFEANYRMRSDEQVWRISVDLLERCN